MDEEKGWRKKWGGREEEEMGDSKKERGIKGVIEMEKVEKGLCSYQ